MTKLLRIEESTYTDQHGFEHKCWQVVEEVEVQPTGEHYCYQYYSELIKNPYYRATDGREWVAMVATDYGGSTSWSRMRNGEAVRDGRWVRDHTTGDKPMFYGFLPLIRKETT